MTRRLSKQDLEAHSRLNALISEAFADRCRLGFVPFGGRWLRPEEAVRQARRWRRARWVVLIETAGLILGIIAFAALLLLVLQAIAY